MSADPTLPSPETIPRPRIGRRLIPLLDVLFLLLAFFIVMPHGVRSVQRDLAAPPDWNAQEIERLIDLRQRADGQVELGPNVYTIDELADLAELPGPDAKALVVLRVDWSTRLRDARRLRALLDGRKLVYVVLQERRR